MIKLAETTLDLTGSRSPLVHEPRTQDDPDNVNPTSASLCVTTASPCQDRDPQQGTQKYA
jgi:hypothetical protein